MRVTRVRGLHAAENGGTPAVELVLAPAPSRSTRVTEISLSRAAFFPEQQTVLVVLRATTRDADGFVSSGPPKPTVQRIALAQLKSRKLSGFRIVVQDDAGDTLGEGAWS